MLNALLRGFPFCDTDSYINYDIETESSMEATSPIAPRPGRVRVDAVDGFGGWSVELEAALTS